MTDAARPPYVAVCGLPGSGNRIILQYLQRSGIRGMIIHGYPESLETLDHIVRGNPENQFYAIIPVRHPKHQLRSLDKPGTRVKDWHDHAWLGKTRSALCGRLAHHKIPVQFFSYEAFVQDPKAVMFYLYDFLGWDHRTKDFSDIFDGNKRP